MRPNYFDFTLATADADGICASQKPTGAAALTLDGALTATATDTTTLPTVTHTVAVLDRPRHVFISSDADDSGAVFTVTGLDAAGSLHTETLAGPNAGAVATALNYRRVLSVSIDKAAVGNLTVGTGNTAETPWMPLSTWRKPFSVGLEANFIGSASMSIQWQTTLGDVQDPSLNEASHAATNAGSAQTADGVVNLSTPVRAVRAKVTSFVSGTVKLGVIQA